MACARSYVQEKYGSFVPALGCAAILFLLAIAVVWRWAIRPDAVNPLLFPGCRGWHAGTAGAGEYKPITEEDDLASGEREPLQTTTSDNESGHDKLQVQQAKTEKVEEAEP
eukprot:SAG31_NODE_219_length_19926_cov_4.297297_4_plen_111_part_00